MNTSVHHLVYQSGEELDLEYKEWESSHGYWVKPPSKYAGRKQGVTTCQAVLDKPGLKQWAANMVCDWIKTNAEEYKDGWYLEAEDLAEAKYAHKVYTKSRADVGTLVHNWYEAHTKGVELPITPDMKLGVENILKYEEEYKPEYLFSERVMYSIKHDYAGKCDTGVIINGKYGIVDLKTGKPDEEFVRKTSRTGKSYRVSTDKWRARGEHMSQNAGYDIGFSELDGRQAEFYGVLYVDCLEGRRWFFRSEEVDFYKEDFLTTLKKYRQIKERDYKVNKYQ